MPSFPKKPFKKYPNYVNYCANVTYPLPGQMASEINRRQAGKDLTCLFLFHSHDGSMGNW